MDSVDVSIVSDESREFAQGLALKHMRILDGHPRLRITITSAPSEPLLSLATTAFFRNEPVQLWKKVLEDILSVSDEIDIGERGEAYVRALLSMSTDFAALRPHLLPGKPLLLFFDPKNQRNLTSLVLSALSKDVDHEGRESAFELRCRIGIAES